MTGVRNPARCPLFLDRAFLDLDEIIDADDVEQFLFQRIDFGAW